MEKYSYLLMRYVHDPVREEIVNIGLLVYCENQKKLRFFYRERLAELKHVFPDINVSLMKKYLKSLQQGFDAFQKKALIELNLDKSSINQIAQSLLPPDSSALRWGEGGQGVTKDVDAVYKKLLNRYINLDNEKKIHKRKEDHDVWLSFSKELQKRNLLEYFTPRKINIGGFEEEFEHTYKNGQIHCLKPLSFDYTKEGKIKTKVFEEAGKYQLASNIPTTDQFKVYYLLGEPSNKEFSHDFDYARSALEKIGKVFVEGQAGDFSSYIEENIDLHD